MGPIKWNCLFCLSTQLPSTTGTADDRRASGLVPRTIFNLFFYNISVGIRDVFCPLDITRQFTVLISA